jgi:hypothetical protein
MTPALGDSAVKDFGGDGPTQYAPGQSPTQVAAAIQQMQASGADTTETDLWNQVTGGMTIEQFQSMPEAEQQQADSQVVSATDAVFYPESTWDKVGGDIALAASLVAGGYAIAPLAAAGAAGAGLGTGAVSAVGTPLLTTAGSIAAGAGTGAGVGALQSALTGTSLGKDVGLGALGGGLAAAVQPLSTELSESTGLPSGVSSALTKAGASELTGLASSTLTSPSGSGTPGAGASSVSTPADQAINPVTPSLATPATPATTPTSTSSASTPSAGLGALSSLIPSASTVAGMAPYLAVGAIGLEQANAGESQAANYSATQQKLAQPAITQSNSLLGNYNSGKINPTDQAASTTQIQQGNTLLSNPNLASLSNIAQTAFANYNSGKLNAADQTQLDQNTAAAKQQVASQLAAAGITDSSILSQQYNQIDNNAQIQKQTMLNNYFNTGNQAYNQWLTTTEAGQSAIVAGQKIASDSLQTELANSMAEANIGIGEMNTAISTQMQTDAEYAAQVSQLMGTLATAYAKSIASTSSGGGSKTSTGGLPSGAAGPAGSAPGAGSLNSPVPTGAAGNGLYSQGATTGDNSLQSEAQPDLNSMANPGDTPLNFESGASGASSAGSDLSAISPSASYMDSAFSQDSTDLSNLFGSVG